MYRAMESHPTDMLILMLLQDSKVLFYPYMAFEMAAFLMYIVLEILLVVALLVSLMEGNFTSFKVYRQ